MGINSNLFAMDRQLLNVRLSQLSEYSNREILRVMRDEAELVADKARENAPHDEGFLEQAIEVVESRDGINTRTTVSVQVNQNAVDDRGQSVYQYAMLQNELLGPFGAGIWKLGQGSIDKDGGRGVVGGKFLERAIISRQAIIGRRINIIARKVFG